VASGKITEVPSNVPKIIRRYPSDFLNLRGGSGPEGSATKHVQKTSDEVHVGMNSTQPKPQNPGSSGGPKKTAKSAAIPEYDVFPGEGIVEVPEEFMSDSKFRERLSRQGSSSWAYTDDPKVLMQLIEK
jgi:hypothetical protein